MNIDTSKIKDFIKQGIPDADVTLEDLRGDSNHYALYVVSSSFVGKTRIEQQKMVHAALQDRIGDDLNAIAIQTKEPSDS